MFRVAAPQLPAQRHGAALRRARFELGVSQGVLGQEINRIRARRGLKPLSEDGARQQVSRFERDKDPVWPGWRPILATALQTSQEQLFGFFVDSELPRPLLHHMVVTEDVVGEILARCETHVRAENMFGPAYAQDLVDRDLATIEALIRVAPAELRRDARRAAALVAELGGWIAQDSGDKVAADRLTTRAQDLARAADHRVQAMIGMRRSNVLTTRDPVLASDLIAEASDLMRDIPDPGRLPASIARQQANAAIATKDAKAFHEHAWYAAELAMADPAAEELTAYATPAYIAAETASGLILLNEADRAIDLLQPHVDKWPAGQQRDHAVAQARLLRALVTVGDYRVAAEQTDEVVRAYLATPCTRARTEFRLLNRLLHDRRRNDRTKHVDAIRVKIARALQGDDPDA